MSRQPLHKNLVRGMVFSAFAFLAPGITLAYPVDSPLTALVEAQEPGTWMRVNENQFQNVWTPTAQRSTPGAGSPRYVISAWSGGAYDSNTGDFYVWGGDNGTYSGNEVYRWTASTLNWERLSLPSAITSTTTTAGKTHWHTIDGTDHSPISGETFDNVVYLPGLKRLAIMAGNAYPGGGKQYMREDGVTRAGPFFFDPAKADPNKVGGLTGSHANPAQFPNVTGGNMWENRQTIQTSAGIVGPRFTEGGVSAATMIDGKDVVFVAEQGKGGYGRLFKYTVNSENAAEDEWELVGIMGKKTYSGSGVGAYDSTRNMFLRTAKTSHTVYDDASGTYVKKALTSFMFWDLNNAGTTNPLIFIPPDSILGDELVLTSKHGMDYDPITDAYYLWSGTNELWKLIPPEGISSLGWSIERIFPEALGPTLAGAKFTGVYGKWNYMDGLGAFMGVAHDVTGDVWIYKPAAQDYLIDDDSIATLFAGKPLDDYLTKAVFDDQRLHRSVSEPGSLALLALALTALWNFGRTNRQAGGRASPL
ncbi:hypothetical protein [Thauera sp. Sel9]|uniref:hypothetical protein n=1 Tax=Thauera sp. Sel9 TaxID=2974299 RepID=UPI0021E158A3|nr:hypothetical protein [Thauera sp. Sel9]MCV2217544.1 hypothetical protein [Thauera sp. Sel9]